MTAEHCSLPNMARPQCPDAKSSTRTRIHISMQPKLHHHKTVCPSSQRIAFHHITEHPVQVVKGIPLLVFTTPDQTYCQSPTTNRPQAEPQNVVPKAREGFRRRPSTFTKLTFPLQRCLLSPPVESHEIYFTTKSQSAILPPQILC
jgi:hypothetical protein